MGFKFIGILYLSCFLVKRKNGESKNLPHLSKAGLVAGESAVPEGSGNRAQRGLLLTGEGVRPIAESQRIRSKRPKPTTAG